jgi:hypothetical protein
VLRHILQAVLLVGRGGHGALADGFGASAAASQKPVTAMPNSRVDEMNSFFMI